MQRQGTATDRDERLRLSTNDRRSNEMQTRGVVSCYCGVFLAVEEPQVVTTVTDVRTYFASGRESKHGPMSLVQTA